MALQLAAHVLPQCFHTGSTRRFVVPVPWSSGRLPREIELYEKSSWRAETMSLLNFLRRSNSKGEISYGIRQRYEDEKPGCSMNEFANKCSTQGSTMVATILYSRRNDNFFKQWMLLHVPVRSLDSLWHPSVDEIPEDLQGLALCLHHCSKYWQSMLGREHHIENTIASVKDKTETIERTRSGNYEPSVDNTCNQDVADLPEEKMLSGEQQEMMQRMLSEVMASVEKRSGETV